MISEEDDTASPAESKGGYKDRQAEEGSPGKERLIRPTTPERRRENFVSSSRLSGSEGPSSSLEQDGSQEGLRDFLAGRQVKPAAASSKEMDDRSIVTTTQQAEDRILGQEAREPGGGAHCANLVANSGECAATSGAMAVGRIKTSEASADQAKSEEALGISSGPGRGDERLPLAVCSQNPSPSKPPAHDSLLKTSWSACAAGGPPVEAPLAAQGLVCETCDVVATSEMQLVSHLEGKKHKRFVAMAELGSGNARLAEAEEPEAEELHCDLCDVTAPSAHHKEYHLRGQKHQRKQKQHQLMEASAELASSSVNALLADDSGTDRETGEPAELFKEGDAEEARPLRSPFEVFEMEGGQPPPPAAAVGLQHRRSGSSKFVRFNGNLESFSEEPVGGEPDSKAILNAAPSLTHAISTGSFKLISGGSFSSPAAHFCPVCGIIATSEANLQDHLRGRRHARRLQYLSHMPEQEQRDQLQRTVTSGSGVFRQGSLVLPSSMDLTAYIGRIAQVHPPASGTAADRLAPLQRNKSLSSQRLSWSSADGLHLRMNPATSSPAATTGVGAESDDVEATEAADGEEADEKGRVPKPQPRCEICGITTTSEAHMEAHVAGRKHRRRVEAATGRIATQQSPHYCPLCDISTTSAAHLSLHLVGRAHRRRQKAIEDGEFPLPLSQTVALAAAEHANSDGYTEPAQSQCGESVSAEDGSPTGGGNAAQSISTVIKRRERERSGQLGAVHLGRDYGWQPPPTGQRSFSGSWQFTGAQAGVAGRPLPGTMPAPGPFAMGMLPYHAQPFYPSGPVAQVIQGAGPAPFYGFWPPSHQAAAPAAQHGLPKSSYQHPPPPQYQYQGHYGMLPPQTLPGSWPSAELPSEGWPSPDVYSCEVCNVHIDKIDEYRQHVRGKQHMRRLHNASDARQ